MAKSRRPAAFARKRPADLERTAYAPTASPRSRSRPAGCVPSGCCTVFKADEGDWRQIEALPRAESMLYVGRAVVAPAGNGRATRKSSGTLVVGELACVDGLTVRRRPADPPPFRVPPTAHG